MINYEATVDTVGLDHNVSAFHGDGEVVLQGGEIHLKFLPPARI